MSENGRHDQDGRRVLGGRVSCLPTDPRRAGLFARLAAVARPDGELIVLSGRNPAEFVPIRRYQVSSAATWSQPAIVGNRLFVKDVEAPALWTFA